MLEKHVYSDPKEVVEQPVELSADDLERDYKYHMAVKLTKKLLEEGQITQEEYEILKKKLI